VLKLRLLKGLIAGILFFFTGNMLVSAHPVHVSVCNIEFSGKESIVSIRLFSDDFGMVIHDNFNEELILSRADENPYRDCITNYINSNLQLFTGGNERLKLIYDYSENDGETDGASIWLYFRIDYMNLSDNLKITNTLMLDLYKDQTNLLIINYEGKQDGFRFNYLTRELDIELQ